MTDDNHEPAAETGRIVLVTGGSRGIGLAVARRFESMGDRVAVTYHSSPPPDGLYGVRCDVTSNDDVDAAFTAVEQRFGGPVEILVSNAGITNDGLLLRMSEDDFTSVIDANLTAAYRVVKRAARGMLKARAGRIVLVSSVVGLLGSAGQANYAASKAGQIGMMRSLAKETAKRKITVNCISPGFISTELLEGLSEEQVSHYKKMVPMKRFGKPQEVADAVLFLAGPQASYVSGTVLEVTGGL